MINSYPIKSPRKLIEVALPLDAINIASAKEKSIRHGHPSTLHLWWARRPLAAARAVIFAQLVNDPGYQQGGGFKYGKNKKEAAIERKRLFKIIEDLVLWENTTNEEVLERARAEIRRSWREVCELNKTHPQASELFNPEKLPALHDPFAGGGSIPMEAQRLGLEAYASDLNPVAVLINKAMIEIPPRFTNHPAVNPDSLRNLDHSRGWMGAQGLADDIRYYGSVMRDEAKRRVGHLYPTVPITSEMAQARPDLKPLVGRQLTVIAWLWARTVRSPNPAFRQVHVPLVSSFMLSNMAGKEAYVEPIVEGDHYKFTVKVGKPSDLSKVQSGTKPAGRGSNFECLVSGSPIDGKYIKAEGQAGRMKARLMAIVAEGVRGRTYLSPTPEMESLATQVIPSWKPEQDLIGKSGDQLPLYGMRQYWQLFTPRQLVTLTTLSDLVNEMRDRVKHDAIVAGLRNDDVTLDAGGAGATAYADAVAVYLGLLVSKLADKGSTLCTWDVGPTSTRTASGRSARVATVRVTFARQALSMTWDFAEVNFFSDSVGSLDTVLRTLVIPLDYLPNHAQAGFAKQFDAATTKPDVSGVIVATDPPYYDNIGYADLSDFFYVWIRHSLRPIFPNLLATLAVPKAEELVATPYRHGTKENAEAFFLDGMTKAMHQLAEQTHPAFPVTIYYAFKQSETKTDEGTSNAGWEAFLGAIIRAGLAISGTWPIRTELSNRMIGIGSNALASSIVLVCRRLSLDAITISRREFLRELNTSLPEALDEMTKGSGDDRSPVAPVDLSQAIIGPGMAVFSKYSAVLEADGNPMSVHAALQLINRFLAEDDFDPDTQFCLHWFEQHGWGEGRFGDADTLSRAKGTSVDGVRDAGVVESGGGIVRLLKWSEYTADWDPQTDTRNPVWETLHHLIRALKQEGETGAGRILAAVKGKAEAARQLSYRLYTLCERQGWSEDARAYNELITSWTGIESAAGTIPTDEQSSLFEP